MRYAPQRNRNRYIGTKCRQRNVSLDIVLAAGNFCSTYTTCYHNFDTLCAGLHRAAHRLLHRAAEGYTVLQLLCYILGNQLSIALGSSYFQNIQG